ncbi:MAG: hypothetical protein RIC81_09300 [Microcella pacifica]|uniref:hypothetical protein n=1 Tax=Microcella pacifica TaxID=2591847 RepID=UPI00331488F7
MVLLVSAVGLGLVLMGGVSAVVASTFGAVPVAEAPESVIEGDQEEPQAVETEEASEPEVTEEPTPPPPARLPLPDACESMYSASMVAQLKSYGVVLNPGWTTAPGAGVKYQDEQLAGWLAELPQLRCVWVPPTGPGGYGLESRIVAVTDAEAARVQERLAALGYQPLQELGGTRYFFSVEASEEGFAAGESHIVVGGYWFATSWVELGINGYTADMVTTLLR